MSRSDSLIRPESNLEQLVLILTYACQLRCKMCGQVDGVDNAPNSFGALKGQLPIESIKQCINELTSLKNVYLFGGEPLLYSDIIPLLEYLQKKKLRFSFSTNGLLLKRFAPAIVDTQVSQIFVSIDSHNEKIHDAIRGKEGAFKTSLLALDRVFDERKKRGSKKPRVNAQFTITPDNYRSLINYYDFFAGEFPEIASIIFHFPRFATRAMGEEYMRIMGEEFGVETSSWQGNLSNGDYIQRYADIDTTLIYEQLTELLKRPKSAITGPVEKEEIRQYFHEPHVLPKDRTCTCSTRCGIQPNGDVVTCVDYPDYVIGNINEKSITEIWNGDKLMRWKDYLTAHRNPGVLVKCSRLYPTSIKKRPLIYRVTSKLRRVLNA